MGCTLWTPNNEAAGMLPLILRTDDPRPAREQAQDRYAHGGGWDPFRGFKLHMIPQPHLTYPGDPAFRLIAHSRIRDEILLLFESSWLAIVQPNGDYEISRMD